MFKTIAALLLVAGIAGCGSSTPTTSSTSTAPSAAQARTGYYDMGTLERGLQAAANRKLVKQGSVAFIKHVQCILTGAQTAECNAKGSDGSTKSIGVHISRNGLTFITDSN